MNAIAPALIADPDWPFVPPLSAREMVPGSYDVIMVDPPWSFKSWGKKLSAKSADAQYGCMALADICALPIRRLAARDCWLFLWATHPMLPHAFHVLNAWGFEFSTSGVWVKRNPATGKMPIGTGHVRRCSSEPFLIGRVGKPKCGKSSRTVIEGPRRDHSRKPDEAYADVERWAFPNGTGPDGGGEVRRADLFSKETRPGWDDWGDERGYFNAG